MHPKGVQDPGLDRHAWESEWAILEPLVQESPVEALPELADLVERILRESGYDISDPVVREGEEREVVAEYLAAREIADLLERGSEAAGPGEVASAVNGLRAIHDALLADVRGTGRLD